MADDFGFFSSSEGAGAEEDPAAAFLAQQESEIAGIENDEGFGPTDGESAAGSAGQAAPPEPGERGGRGRGPGGAWVGLCPLGPQGGDPPACTPRVIRVPRGMRSIPSGRWGLCCTPMGRGRGSPVTPLHPSEGCPRPVLGLTGLDVSPSAWGGNAELGLASCAVIPPP